MAPEASHAIAAQLSGHHTEGVLDIAFVPENPCQMVTTSADTTARLWDIGDGKETCVGVVAEHDGAVRTASFSPHPNVFVTAGDRSARVWDLRSKHGTSSPSSSSIMRPEVTVSDHGGLILGAKWRPGEGRELMTFSTDSQVMMYSTGCWEPIWTIRKHKGAVMDLSFANDGIRMSTTSVDKVSMVWNAGNRFEEYELKNVFIDKACLAARLAEDGTGLIVAHNDSKLAFWDISSPKVEPVLLEGHAKSLRTCCFRPQKGLAPGALVAASLSELDGTLRVWSVRPEESRGELACIPVGSGMGTCCCFSPDGKLLGVAGEDKVARFYKMEI